MFSNDYQETCFGIPCKLSAKETICIKYEPLLSEEITVDSRYLEFQGTVWNTSIYPYFDISDLQNWGKTNSI